MKERILIMQNELLQEFETVKIREKGTILGIKDGWITVFNYYG